MTKLTSLGINAAISRIRTFDYKGQTIRVRIPLEKEWAVSQDKIHNPDSDLIQQQFHTLWTEAELDDSGFNDSDLNTLRTQLLLAARYQAITQIGVLEAFRMLEPLPGQSIDDLTYEDINAEIPLAIQMDFAKKIREVIEPGYEDARGN